MLLKPCLHLQCPVRQSFGQRLDLTILNWLPAWRTVIISSQINIVLVVPWRENNITQTSWRFVHINYSICPNGRRNRRSGVRTPLFWKGESEIQLSPTIALHIQFLFIKYFTFEILLKCMILSIRQAHFHFNLVPLCRTHIAPSFTDGLIQSIFCDKFIEPSVCSKEGL